MFGDLLGAGLGFISGMMNRSAQEEANERQYQLAQQNMAQQKEFAQHGIRWKVADAQAAGLHPLAALGATTTSFSPVSVGDVSAPTLDLGPMGQNIGRAIDAASTAEEKGNAVTAKMQALQLERGELENSLLKTQIMKANQPAARQPSMPASNVKYGVDGQPATAVTTTSGFPVSEDKIEQKPDTVPKYARGSFLGLPFMQAPGSMDAEDLETRYSDIGEKLGLANIPLDVGYTIWKNYIEHRVGGRTFQDRWPDYSAPKLTSEKLKRIYVSPGRR